MAVSVEQHPSVLEIKPAFPGQEIVVLTDWDDSAVGKEWYTRAVGNCLRMLTPHSLSKKTLADFPSIDCTPIDRPLSFAENIAAKFHLRRRPILGVVESLSQVIADGGKVVIASGRKANKKMYDGTRIQAEEAGLQPIEIVHTPDDMSGKVIKAVTAKRVGATHIIEDDPDTIKYVKREVPGIQVVHIDQGLHLGNKYLAENPNISVVYAKDLMKRRKAKGASETRNSPLREHIDVPIQVITKAIHKELPWLTPTHLNFLGAAEVAAGAAIAASRDPLKKGGEKLKTLVSVLLIVYGSLLDAFDGSLARLKAAEDPNSVDFKKGGIYDVLSDRFQELALALSRAWSAAKRKSKIGAIAALAAAVTNPWPSIARAASESQGKQVPEGGKGIVGLIGTRPGKAVLGGVATEFPKPWGLPLQPAVDIAITGSNILTAAQRLRTAFGPSESILSQVIRGEAKTRLKFLAGAGIAAGVAGGLGYLLLKDRINAEPEPKTEANFLDVMNEVEIYCIANKLDHRNVGGGVTEFMGPQTKFKIDIAARTVTLINPNRPTLRRKDGSIRDIDLIVFTPSQIKYWEAKRDFDELKSRMEEAGVVSPKITVESARHPAWSQKRSKWKQFVTAWEIWESYSPSLAFGDIRKAIKPGSVEPWTLDTGLGVQLTMLNPVAHALCYELRVPSGVKKKDREEIGNIDNLVVGLPYSKISLVRALARQTIEEGSKHGVDYNELFKEWRSYIDELSQNPDRLTAVKSRLTGLYWDTVGEWLTHHTSGLNDKMSG